MSISFDLGFDSESLLSDKEVTHKTRKSWQYIHGVLDFLASVRAGDYDVTQQHGVKMDFCRNISILHQICYFAEKRIRK